MSQQSHSPLELSFKALVLGAVLSAILTSANAYIGLLVGMTVSASIPAAAVSMGVLRLFKKSSIYENNMVQTAASAGESLVAGIIFTLPALVLMGAWNHYKAFTTISIALVGGILGVAFTIPLRRALIVETGLTFPEGVATSEVLKSGNPEAENTNENSKLGLKFLLQASGIGALFKLLESGLGWISGSVKGVFTLFSGNYLFMGNLYLSPALIGVGYIVGLNTASLVFMGGIIGTVIGVPLNWIIHSETLITAAGLEASTPWQNFTTSQWSAIASASWSDCRRVGIGAMMVGGLWSVLCLIRPLIRGVQSSIKAYAELKSGVIVDRKEQDTPVNIVFAVILLSIIPLFLIFYSALGAYENRFMVSILMTALMLILGFIFSSVAGYMAGLVGSSNNPISGVTIATVILSSVILLQIMGNQGAAATLGPIAVIFLAGLICSSAAIAGDNMQDLKCGYLIGATPWRQQVSQVIGVVAGAMVIPWVLNVLDKGYGIGRAVPGGNPDSFLAAPQAGLMNAISTGIFGAGIQWNYIFLGCLLAVIIIFLDQVQKKRGSSFRFPVLAVAVGIYLPMGLSVPIFLGGLVAYFIGKKLKSVSPPESGRKTQAGLLVASGLITGEALMGVVLAVVAAFVVSLPSAMSFGGVTGVLALGLVLFYLHRKTSRA